MKSFTIIQMNLIKRLFYITGIAIAFQVTPALAQDSLTVNFGATITSRYILNGIDVGGKAPAVQPTASIAKKGLEFGFWGSFALSSVNANEMDFYVQYTYKNVLSFRVMDIFWPNDNLGNNEYLNYNFKGFNSKHNIRLSADYKPTQLPIAFHFQTFVYRIDDQDANGKKQYSSYGEINYLFTHKSLGIKPFLGFTPAKGVWGNEFAVVATGVELKKNLKITNTYYLPLSTKLIINPHHENIFFITSITI